MHRLRGIASRPGSQPVATKKVLRRSDGHSGPAAAAGDLAGSPPAAKLLIASPVGTVIFPGDLNYLTLVKKLISIALACLASATLEAQTIPFQSNSVVRFRITHGSTLLGEMDVELFDADKPVTVSNFLAYAQSGAFNKSILHRAVPGFVLQGGFGTVQDPTSLTPFTFLTRISARPAITNEYFVGPQHSNTFGTLAMALADDPSNPGTPNPNSATTSWFFNLTNNAALNPLRFTVFGRIISGTNILQDFNARTQGNGLVNMTNAAYVQNCSRLFLNPGGFAFPLTDLPVGPDSGQCPRYADVLQVQVIMVRARDVLPPTVTVTSPRANASLTNENVVISGTAGDNFAVGQVVVSLNGGLGQVAAHSNGLWLITVTNVPPGTNTILVRVFDEAGHQAQITRKFFRSVRVPFVLQTTGLGTVKGATNNAMLEVGRGYALTARPGRGYLFGGWSGSNDFNGPTLKFIMQSNWNLTATFVTNLFPWVKGTYNGLFHDTTLVEQMSSGFVTLTVGDAGSYSGKLLLNSKSHSLKGTFWVDGTGTNTVTRPGTNALRVIMALDLTNGTDQINGLVSEETSSNPLWSVDLVADRAVFGSTNPAPLAGNYTMVLPADPSPEGPFGDGYGTVSVSTKGAVSFSGALADGTKVSQKTGLSKIGQWPLYVPLYKGKGALVSWVTFDTNAAMTDFSGTLNWFKQTQTAKYFPSGFTNETTVIGSRFEKPASTNWVLNLTNAVVGFTNGNLMADFTNTIAIDAKGKVINESTNKLTLSASKPSGLFNGSAMPPAGGKAVSFKGAVLRKQTNGFGFFLGTNASGRVSIERQP